MIAAPLLAVELEPELGSVVGSEELELDDGVLQTVLSGAETVDGSAVVSEDGLVPALIVGTVPVVLAAVELRSAEVVESELACDDPALVAVVGSVLVAAEVSVPAPVVVLGLVDEVVLFESVAPDVSVVGV